MTDETISVTKVQPSQEETIKRIKEIVNNPKNEKFIDGTKAGIICIMGVKQNGEHNTTKGIFTTYGNLPDIMMTFDNLQEKFMESLKNMIKEANKKHGGKNDE